MEISIEKKGARKRKSTAVTRILQNNNSEPEKTEPEIKENISLPENFCETVIEEQKQETVPPIRIKKETIDSEYKIYEYNENDSINNEFSTEGLLDVNLLKQEDLFLMSESRVTLVERALGSFNASKDESAENNPLNVSVTRGPPFSCTICKCWYYSGEKLKLHYAINHKISHCELCSALFENKAEKILHAQIMHETIQCEICQDQLGQYDIWFHYDQDHESIPCTFCGLILSKDTYPTHISLNHKVRPNFNESEIMITERKDQNFFCSLCEKTRQIDIFFGHMKSYHKIRIIQLINLMVKQSININIVGTTVEERTTNSLTEEILPMQTMRLRNTCRVCNIYYSDKITQSFHYIYCQKKVLCYLCNKIFENEICRDKHIKKHHTQFECLNCDYTYNCQENLIDHLLTHDLTACRYCDDYISTNEIDTHLSNVHNYKANIMQNFTETLFELTDFENKNIVLCCLCEDSITDLVENISELFNHFYIEHKLSNTKLVKLLKTKPSFSDYDEFYQEINNSIDYSDDEINNKENNLEMKVGKDVQTDLDPHSVEGVYSEIYESVHMCEICDIKNISLIDFMIHNKERHKISTKYIEYDCKLCSEIFLTDQTLMKHTIVAHSFSDDIYDCDCDNFKLHKCYGNEHILEKHAEELDKFDIDIFGKKCRFCEKAFWTKQELNEHEVCNHLRENEEEFLKCPVCSTCFIDQSCLKEHSNTIHTDYPIYTAFSYKCISCTLTYPNYSKLTDHFTSSHAQLISYRCPLPGCYKTYKFSKNVKAHMRSIHNTMKQESYEIQPCKICGAVMNSVRSLNLHMMVKHRGDKLGYMCRICKMRFHTIEQRKLHCATSHPGELAYVCRDCGRGFASKSGLYGHRKSHATSSVSIICPYCSKEFTRRDSYAEHLLIHTGPKHQCPHCPKQFTQRSNLIRHVRIHTGTKPYSCMYCDKRFSDQGAKKSHERVHTREEHCQCTECGKSFSKWQKLKYHMRLHTGEGLITCEICEKKFTNNYTYNEHKKVHNVQTLIMCECGRGFSNQKYLIRHQQNVHEKTTPKYPCPYCFKQIYRKSGLIDHMQTHADVKPYTCLICNKASYTRRTMRRHLIQKHDIKSDDIDSHIENSNSDTPVNLSELLDEDNMLQVDLIELESLNTDNPEIKIKSEPISEEEPEEYQETPRERRRKMRENKKNAVRSSPRTKNPKLYLEFSDEEI